jgi:hypothetical protein
MPLIHLNLAIAQAMRQSESPSHRDPRVPGRIDRPSLEQLGKAAEARVREDQCRLEEIGSRLGTRHERPSDFADSISIAHALRSQMQIVMMARAFGESAPADSPAHLAADLRRSA